eukprot:Pgem_evm1s15829
MKKLKSKKQKEDKKKADFHFKKRFQISPLTLNKLKIPELYLKNINHTALTLEKEVNRIWRGEF